MTLRFGAIATRVHIAPAPSMIAARIVKEVATTAIVSTLSNAILFAFNE
jgi:hypothetical protein